MQVAVIMSTYNGSKYLNQQIDSILGQVGVDVELFIRDDGSTDDTLEILKEYQSNYNNVHVNSSTNVGFRQSFIQELKAHKGFQYYAFSDQDDYWEDRKLERACMVLQKRNSESNPALYYSNLSLSNEELLIYKTTKLEKRKKTLESAIMRRSIAGCTMVLNDALWEMISKHNISDNMLRRGHDSFIISLCYSIGGSVICDARSYIRYRQHSDNTSGGIHGPKQRIIKEWKALFQKKGQESEMANSILKEWENDITKDSYEILQTISDINNNLLTRIMVFLSPRYTTGDIRLTLLAKIKVLLGLL